MGLDMYLSARKYISGVDYSAGFEKPVMPIEFRTLLDVAGLDDDDIRKDLPSGRIEVTVAYWRKVNAIHNWFVSNCADGEDDCRPMYVSRERLLELLDVVKEAIAEKDADLLPPSSGFFFGSTDIDEWYWKDLEATRDTIQGILDNPKLADWDFEYQASW
mgnify:FL=1